MALFFCAARSCLRGPSGPLNSIRFQALRLSGLGRLAARTRIWNRRHGNSVLFGRTGGWWAPVRAPGPAAP